MHYLRVSMQDRLVGTLSIDENQVYYFVYDDSWREDGFAISPHLGFSTDYSSETIRRFLENLIPEGQGLDDITLFDHISKNNIYAIVKTIGHETAGALVFGIDSEEDNFRWISTEEMTQRIAEIESRSIAIWDKKVRLSLAGVQAKLPIILKDNAIALGNGAFSSTHIMKFQTKKHIHIVVNELFCMKLAKRIGLRVAEVSLRRFESYPVLIVERFDRIYREDYVERLHMIDGCQMLDMPTSYKYEQNFGSSRDVAHVREGVSFKRLFDMTKVCSVPAKVKLELIHWAMYNLIIANSHAHGKNLSFFIDHQGINLTPFYDMLCIIMYDFDHRFAMAYGDEFDSHKVQAYDLRVFADEIGVHHKLVSKVLTNLCNSVIETLDDGVLEGQSLLKDELEFISKLQNLIRQRATNLKTVAEEMDSVSF